MSESKRIIVLARELPDMFIAFSNRHQNDAAFIIPNPESAGSARVLQVWYA